MGNNVVGRTTDDESTKELKAAANDLRAAIAIVRNLHYAPIGSMELPIKASGWNFETFEKYINQRFGDLSLQLRERYEAQQTGVTAALAAAEKAVNAALIAAEKAVDKAENAQQLRNEVANEFRQSLSDLSSLMWTIREGSATVEALSRELSSTNQNLENKITGFNSTRADATEALRKSFDSRIITLETGYANIQGRIWAISAVWALIVLVIDIGVRYIGH
jgi:hypothetical protein